MTGKISLIFGVMIAVPLAPPARAAEPDLPAITVESSPLLGTNPIYRDLDAHSGIPADAGEYLRDLPGVSGIRMGGHGIDPIIRGQSQTRLNILLDGAYSHGGCPNRMDPPSAYAPLAGYDRITVLKGGAQVRHGGGGSGGTVLFERIPPRFEAGGGARGELEAGYQGNSDTRETAFDLAAGNQRGYVRALGGYVEADNYRDGDGRTVRSAHENRAGALLLGYTPDPDSLLEISAERIQEREVLYAGAGMDAPESDNDLWRLKLRRENLEYGPLIGLRSELYYSDVSHLMDNYSLRPLSAPMKMRAPTTSETLGGRFSGLFATDRLEFSLGLDHQQNQREALRQAGPPGATELSMLQSLLWPEVDIRQTGLFMSLDLPLAGDALLSGGLRYDRVRASAGRAAEAPQGVSPNDLYQRYYGQRAEDHTENNLGGFARYERPLNTQTTWSLSISRSLRTADASERYMAANAMMGAQRWVGNPRLDPEQHHQVEFSLDWRNTHWQSAAALFYNQVTDYILRDRAHGQSGILQADSASIYRNVDARFYGLEWQLQARWRQHWQADFGLAYVNARNTTDERPLAQTPPLEGSLGLSYRERAWQVGAKLRFAARQDRVDADMQTGSGQDAGPTPGFGVLDLFADYRLNRHVELRGGVDNLFDRAYAYHVNRANADPFNPDATRVNEPGRALWLKLKARF